MRGAVGRQVAARFEDQGEQAVKNIAEPVRAFRVRSLTDGASARVPGREAALECERSAALDQWYEDQMLLTAIHAQKGDAAKAAIARAELLKSQPGMTIENSIWMRVSDVPAFRKQLEEHANAGLRKAGIPER